MFDFSSILGSVLVNNTKTVETSSINGKYVGLYFCATWCGTCRQFSTIITKAYQICQKNKQPFELVVISRDVTKDNFDLLMSKFPWYAIPYENENLREQLCKMYSVVSLPFLVMINPEGEIINLNARQFMTQDLFAFPWKELSIYEHLSPYLRRKFEKVDVSTIKNKCLILLFTASWSNASHKFTTKLLSIYNTLKDQGKEFEVVMCCGDKKQVDYDNYISTFPWLNIGFNCKELRPLIAKYNISGYPSCVIFDKDGIMCQINGLDSILAEDALENYPWLPRPVLDVNNDPEGINNYPSVVLLCDKKDAVSDEEIKDKIDLLKQVGENSIKNKEYFRLKYFYADKNESVAQQIRHLTHITTCPALLLLHLPDRGSYYLPTSNDITYDSINTLVSDFLSSKLTRHEAIL
ncbi:hypothetical protein WA158_000764 [Blastocystis sp. Blastoise]